jgi:hypothetical protein
MRNFDFLCRGIWQLIVAAVQRVTGNLFTDVLIALNLTRTMNIRDCLYPNNVDSKILATRYTGTMHFNGK